jgi:aminomethyltransferase
LSPDDPVRPTPLEPEHRALGATFASFAGWRLPLRFSGDLAEHRAVREAAGLFDISHMGQIGVVGPDAARGLARALTADVSRLGVGVARYTMICAPDGGVLDDLIVYRLDEEEYLVIANAANTATVFDALCERTAEEDVAVTDHTDARALLSVQGPAARAVLEGCRSGNVELPGRYRSARVVLGGVEALVVATGYSGEAGFECSVDAGDAAVLWRALLGAGAPLGMVPAGLAARDSLRLEAALPLYGHELGLDRTPFSAGYGFVVDLDHDFVGDAALRDVAARGPSELLVGLVTSGKRAPRQGYAISDEEGRVVGAVTSGGPSPTLGVPIALGYVTSTSASVGTTLLIDVRGRAERAEVVALPFYRRPRVERPAS